MPENETVEPPSYLDADTRAVWDRLAPSLTARGVLTAWDADVFAVFCTAVVHHRRAVELVNQSNVLTKAAGANHIVKNPALQVIRDQAAVIATLAGRFGLTPADRAGLALSEESDDDVVSFLALVRTPVGDTSAPGPEVSRPSRRGGRGSARPATDAVAADSGRRRPRTAG